MAICPNCKLEYEDGITICTDCNCLLVDKLPDFEFSIPMYYGMTEEEVQYIIDTINRF